MIRIKISHHSIQDLVAKRFGGTFLKGYNDLQTKFPLVAERWDSKKNGIEANQVFPFSNKKAWWKCSCGCEWEAVINYMSRKNICPRCGKTN